MHAVLDINGLCEVPGCGRPKWGQKAVEGEWCREHLLAWRVSGHYARARLAELEFLRAHERRLTG